MDPSIAGLTGIDAYIARMQALKQIPSLDALTHEHLASMPMDELAFLRNNMFTDQASQDRIAPYEHRAYAREAATSNPLFGLGIAMAAPVYQAKKPFEAPGMSRTGASLEALKQAMIGAGEGTYASFQNAGNNMYSGLRGLMR